MSLDLSKAGVVDDGALQAGAQSAYDMLDEVKHKMLKDLGVKEMPAPKVEPEPIANVDVVTIDNRELGALHTQYVAYSVYLSSRLAEVISLERAARGNLKRVAATIKNELRAEGVKETHISAQLEIHPVYTEYYIEHLKLFMMKEIVESLYKAYRDMAAALSRNVTLRELEFQQQQREDNVGKSKGSSKPRRGGKPFSGRRG